MSGSALTSGPWVTERGLMLLVRQASEHQPDHADLHLRLAGPHVPLVVPAVDPAPTQPRERPLHRPADRQRLERLLTRRPAHHLDDIPTVGRHPAVQVVVVVLVI